MLSSHAARPLLTTERLVLRASDVRFAPAVCDFQRRNRDHFAPWDPPTADRFYTIAGQLERLQQAVDAFAAGTGFRYWLTMHGHPGRVIGSVHFSSVTRGAFHNAMLGYALDAAVVGRGLMTEALAAAIAEMFSPRVNLHRIQANHRPDNLRSAAVLERLGFRTEGIARQYLYIDGAWRDHVMTAKLNPDFAAPPEWASS